MKISKNIQCLLVTGMCFVFTLPILAQDMSENSIAVDPMKISAEMTTFDCPPFIPEGCTITVLQGDHTKGNFDILFKIPANFDVPKHWHTSPERMVLLSGTLEVTYDGEATQVLKTGDYAYGPAKKPHTARCGDDGPCTLFIAFENPLDAHPVEE
ncbi:cupin domain-containing protein [Robertkochia flava]|uniref:cupin domain-containing protein n=1 Tax=Robertkochia flava TaxID=3447986 RepID=UPI001CD03BCD|nr:cupin domain-containing protein [Robertkochia marina]